MGLTVVLALLLGAASAGVWTRVHFARTAPTFRCKVRWPDRGQWDGPAQWPRHRLRAAWVHDVLLVQRGILRPHTLALGVRAPDRAVRATSRSEVAGLGARPVVLTLWLDDGRVVDVAARSGDRSALVGPFVAAALPGLPPAPSEPRPRGG